MNIDREALELECQLRIVEMALSHDSAEPIDPLELAIESFWEGVRAVANRRSLETLQGLLEMRRARAAGLIK